MKLNKILIIVMMFVMLALTVFGQPPFTEQSVINLDSPLFIETLEIQEHDLNTPFYLHTHLYSKTSGLIKDPVADNISCDYHLYSENINWEHLTTGNLTSYGAGMFTNINETYFNESGEYAILLWCECNGCISDRPEDLVGGFTRFSFFVGEAEEDLSFKDMFYPALIISLILILVGFFTKQPIVGIFGGFGIIFVGFMLTGIFIPLTIIGGLAICLLFLFVDMGD